MARPRKISQSHNKVVENIATLVHLIFFLSKIMNGDPPLSISYSQRKYLKIMRLKYYEILSSSFP